MQIYRQLAAQMVKQYLQTGCHTKRLEALKTQEKIMNSKELYAALEQAGYTFGINTEQTGISWCAYRRLIGGKDCLCNDKPPSLIIKPYDIKIGELNYSSATFGITAETGSQHWINFEVYGIKFEEVLNEADKITKMLLAAWNTVADME